MADLPVGNCAHLVYGTMWVSERRLVERMCADHAARATGVDCELFWYPDRVVYDSMFRYHVDSAKIGVAVFVIGTRASNEGETKYVYHSLQPVQRDLSSLGSKREPRCSNTVDDQGT